MIIACYLVPVRRISDAKTRVGFGTPTNVGFDLASASASASASGKINLLHILSQCQTHFVQKCLVGNYISAKCFVQFLYYFLCCKVKFCYTVKLKGIVQKHFVTEFAKHKFVTKCCTCEQPHVQKHFVTECLHCSSVTDFYCTGSVAYF